jgi:pullulanase
MRLRDLQKLWLMMLICLFCIGIGVQAQANQDAVPTPDFVTVPGTIQSKLGCPGDWQPECKNTELIYNADKDVWEATFELPAGSYEYKVALNGTWDVNYGLNGEPGGDNIPLVLEADTAVTFTYDHKFGLATDSVNGGGPVTPPPAGEIPDTVNVPGTIQPLLGCPGEWQPDCAATMLEYNADDDVWMRTFDNLPAGSYEYKVAIDGSWTENYGAVADQDGANISLSVPADTAISFYYDHKTHWIADSVRQKIVTAPGTYQDEIGCQSDEAPDCMRSWLQDVDGDGIYLWQTNAIPAGDYEAQVAVNGTAQGERMTFKVSKDGEATTFAYDSNLDAMVVTAGGAAVSASNLREQKAHWVTRDTFAWNIQVDPEVSYKLLYSADASMVVSLFGLEGTYETLDLAPVAEGLPKEVMTKFPHLAAYGAFRLADASKVAEILKGQFAVAAYKGDQLLDLAGVQIPGVLDDLYTYNGDLGVVWDAEGVPTVTLWAPTARNVEFLLFADSAPRSEPQAVAMTNDAAAGTWTLTGEAGWKNQFYQFRIEVYAPTDGQIVTNDVTDPYSYSLSVNSLRSQLVDLKDPDLKPTGWDTLAKPPLDAPEDIVLYELHIRDFSAFDEVVPPDYRGTYLAFTVNESSGVAHLKRLAAAGLTHIHLLPSFDIATINENKKRWFLPDYEDLAGLPSDSEEQQTILSQYRELDGYNWGYDPYHYAVPEGSYSTNPDGSQRIIEYRQMVAALNGMGLRVVQDVVFNHTNSAGQDARSVLDKIVPGYYHRLDERGVVARSTCCANTATEHNMMRRLMIDTIVLNAVQYKIDGFRFDLMGHHMLDDMWAVRSALDALTIEKDGVDGKAIYVYGEGWDFGEVAKNARGLNAVQLNIAGTGIGVFNDRLRDAVRGGSPFGDQLEQGLSNGVFNDPNGLLDVNADPVMALLFGDLTRVGLAGNLRDYSFTGYDDTPVLGMEVDYNGAPAGYTIDPQENIVYVSAHDNETLYDAIAFKAPRDTTPETRVRMQILAMSYALYAQGVPFIHAGDELLRSKSMDRNSYNSGDWYNRLDYTYETNNFGVGLPPQGDNSEAWPLIQPLLADPALKMGKPQIEMSLAMFEDMLRVRKDTALLRLRTGEQVIAKLTFPNTGSEQMPGVIVMHIDDTQGEDVDAKYDQVVVIFNGSDEEITFSDSTLANAGYELHPMLAAGSDAILKTASYDAAGTFKVPAYSTAVFVVPA